MIEPSDKERSELPECSREYMEWLEGIVAELIKTADGVPIVLGMVVFIRYRVFTGRAMERRVRAVRIGKIVECERVSSPPHIFYEARECYATRGNAELESE